MCAQDKSLIDEVESSWAEADRQQIRPASRLTSDLIVQVVERLAASKEIESACARLGEDASSTPKFAHIDDAAIRSGCLTTCVRKILNNMFLFK